MKKLVKVVTSHAYLYRIFRFIFFTGLLCISITAWSLAEAVEGFTLFSSEEAERLRLSDEEWRQKTAEADTGIFSLRKNMLERGFKSQKILPNTSTGPKIEIKRPALKNSDAGSIIETVSPMDLFVLFEKNRSPVDMTSLEVNAKKGFFSRSLTAKFKPYIDGTSIQVKKLKIPKGKYHIRISIADQNGAITKETYLLHVKKK